MSTIESIRALDGRLSRRSKRAALEEIVVLGVLHEDDVNATAPPAVCAESFKLTRRVDGVAAYARSRASVNLTARDSERAKSYERLAQP